MTLNFTKSKKIPGVTRQGAHLLPRGRIPDQDRLVTAAAGDFATIRAEAHGPDMVRVPPQGRLANKIASRPLFGENLDAVVGVVIARNGEFVAAWPEIDACNLTVDVEGRRRR